MRFTGPHDSSVENPTSRVLSESTFQD